MWNAGSIALSASAKMASGRLSAYRIGGKPLRRSRSKHHLLHSKRQEKYPNLGVLMYTALCIGCLAAFGVGTAIRFGMLAGLLSRTGVLPENWRCWMYDMKSPNPKQ